MVPGMVSSFFGKALLVPALKAYRRGEDLVAIPPRTPLEGKDYGTFDGFLGHIYLSYLVSYGEGARRDVSYILVVLLLPRG